jgi:hypothetical protein
MPYVYEFWPSADMSVPETQLNQGFANRALPVMYLSTANSGLCLIIIGTEGTAANFISTTRLPRQSAHWISRAWRSRISSTHVASCLMFD